ncbi:MAG: hypothetical protein QM765_46650 [Myxococcales bacterium]
MMTSACGLPRPVVYPYPSSPMSWNAAVYVVEYPAVPGAAYIA